MGYLIGANSGTVNIGIGTAIGGWRTLSVVAPDSQIQNLGTTVIGVHDPSFRIRNIKPGTGVFTRDWSSANDRLMPMPFTIAVFLSISPLVFTLALPSVSVGQVVSPSPLVLSLSAPAVDVLRGALTLTPLPLALPIAVPSVSVHQTVTPSPLALLLALPAVDVLRGPLTLTPSPLVLPLTLPDVAITSGILVTPDPLALPLALPVVTLAYGAVTVSPSPLALLLALPAVDVLRGALMLTPSPLVFPVALPAVDVLRGALTLTPLPLIFPVVLPAVTVSKVYYLRPAPLAFPVVWPAVLFVPGPVFLTPDPVQLRLFFPRLKRGVGDPTPGRVLTKTLYQVTLTGSKDSTTDVLLSVQSIQGTLRSTGNDRVAVYVPNGAAVLPGILARLNGTLIVWERLIYSDGTETIGEVIRAPMTEAIRRDRGPTRDTLTLAGQLVAVIPSGTSRTLTVAHQQYLESGNNSWRVPYNVDLRPGDTVIYDATSFRVGSIQINLGVTTREMQLQESE